MKKATLILMVLLLTVPALAAHRTRPHRAKVATLFPTAGSLLAQNAAADRMGLPRIGNRAALSEQVADGSLVPLPTGIALRSTVAPWRAFLLPWAAEQLDSVAKAFHGVWDKPLTVDSAVRPIDVQQRLWRSRRVPAAAPYGPVASVHPTGAAFDIGKRSLTKSQQQWLRWRLFYLTQIGWIIVEEEQACFHVVALRDRDGAASIRNDSGIAPLFIEDVHPDDPTALLQSPDRPNITPDI